MAKIAKVWINKDRGVLTVRTPYTQEFVADIKAEIPKDCRRWDPNGKVWEFDPSWTNKILELLRESYDDVVELDFSDAFLSDTAEDLFNMLTKEDIKDIYRLLSKRYHPDVGGKPEVMTKINTFFQRYRL